MRGTTNMVRPQRNKEVRERSVEGLQSSESGRQYVTFPPWEFNCRNNSLLCPHLLVRTVCFRDEICPFITGGILHCFHWMQDLIGALTAYFKLVVATLRRGFFLPVHTLVLLASVTHWVLLPSGVSLSFTVLRAVPEGKQGSCVLRQGLKRLLGWWWSSVHLQPSCFSSPEFAYHERQAACSCRAAGAERGTATEAQRWALQSCGSPLLCLLLLFSCGSFLMGMFSVYGCHIRTTSLLREELLSI